MVTRDGVVPELTDAANQPAPVLVVTLVATARMPLVLVIWRVCAGGGFRFTSALKTTGAVDIVNRAPLLTFSVTLMVAPKLVAPGALTVTVPK